MTSVPAEGMPKPTGYNGQSSLPANTARITSLEVELKIQGISQTWVRGEDAIMKLAEPKAERKTRTITRQPQYYQSESNMAHRNIHSGRTDSTRPSNSDLGELEGYESKSWISVPGNVTEIEYTEFSSNFLPFCIMYDASVLSIVLLVVSMLLAIALLLTAVGNIVAFWSREDTKCEGTSRLTVVLEVVFQCGSLVLIIWVFAALYNVPLNPFKWRQRIASLRAPTSSEIAKPVLTEDDDSSSTTTRAGELSRVRGRKLAVFIQQEVDQLLKRWLLWLGTPSLVLYLVYAAAILEQRNRKLGLISAARSIFFVIRAFQLVPQVIINYRTKSVAWIPITAYMCELLVNIHQMLVDFFPNSSIPYLLPAQKVTEDTVVYRRSWREPFEYDIKVYASQSVTVTTHSAASFFESAQLLWHVESQSLEKKYPKYSTKVNAKIPLSMFDTMSEEIIGFYAHVFIQKSDQFTPHPNISDPYLVCSPMGFFSTAVRYDNNTRAHSMLSGTPHTPGRKRMTIYHSLLAWDLVLEDRTYTNKTLSKILRRLVSDHPDKKSKTGTYNPPLIYRPASESLTMTSAPAEGMPKPTGSNGQSSLPANTARITSLDVELKIQGISQGWVRGEDAIMRLAEPKAERKTMKITRRPHILNNANVLSIVLLVVSMPLAVALLLTTIGDIVAFWPREDTKWEGTSRLVVVLEVVYQCGSLVLMYTGYMPSERKTSSRMFMLV
ncbi:hypothetical protein GQ54DRAFT_335925 [Martensiomyces pterosporus]|nr:hypothetical protein GQ54DRAFT_335925 [Martensiomyces pterosporus]